MAGGGGGWGPQVVWLLSIGMLVTNFGVNYKGTPYMEALSANKGLSESEPYEGGLNPTLGRAQPHIRKGSTPH